jgi:hypothetical protein
VQGANLGDPLGIAADLVPDDIYRLARGARIGALALLPGDRRRFVVAQGGSLGLAGADLFLDARLSFMCSQGRLHDVLTLVEVDARGDLAAVYLHPLHPLRPRCDYTLMRIDTQSAPLILARLCGVSLAQGTQITLAGGAQRAVEDLCPGDAVLTRDDGAQKLRWIGRHTVRAEGAFAPVRIAAGTLNNTNDLRLCARHRLLVYQRQDHLGLGQAEVLVRAADLVNGISITRPTGGFIDYYQLLFDDHQIIYAEGIAAETLLLDRRTQPILASGQPLPAHRRTAPGVIVPRQILRRHSSLEALRRASQGHRAAAG